MNGGLGLKYGDVAALRHRLAGESLALSEKTDDPAEKFIRLWESFFYEPNRNVMKQIRKMETECIAAMNANRGSLADPRKFRALKRFVAMLDRGGWIPENYAFKKALDVRKAPPKPKAPNMRDY